MAKGRTQQYYDKNPEARKKKAKQQAKYQSSDKQKKDRAGRNKARRMKGDVKGDVHHKNGNPRDNRKSNLQVVSKKKNRGRKV